VFDAVGGPAKLCAHILESGVVQVFVEGVASCLLQPVRQPRVGKAEVPGDRWASNVRVPSVSADIREHGLHLPIVPVVVQTGDLRLPDVVHDTD